MTEYRPRLFTSDAEIARLGEGLLARTLIRADWTHEAHLGATAYLLLKRPEIPLDEALPDIIRSFNESVGGKNSDSEGYHDTITRAFLLGVRLFLAARTDGGALCETVNALLLSPTGRRDWPLRFYSRERLFSVAARRGYLAPDLEQFPVILQG